MSDYHVSFFSSYGPYIVKSSAFLQISANMSKKSKSIKVIYICTSENDMFYWALINSSQDFENLIIKNIADTAEI